MKRSSSSSGAEYYSPKRLKLSESKAVQKSTSSTPADLPPFKFCWAQVFSFPFWPGKILTEIPDGITQHKGKTKSNEPLVCVEFFGKHDYAWVPVSKVIEFTDGDTLPPGVKRSKMTKALQCAIKEAQEELVAESEIKPEIPTIRHFIGLHNLGNTCYINSALQCLHRVQQFNHMLATLDILHTARCQQAELENGDEHKDVITDASSSSSASATATSSGSEPLQALKLLVTLRTIMRIMTDPSRLENAELIEDDMNILTSPPLHPTSYLPGLEYPNTIVNVQSHTTHIISKTMQQDTDEEVDIDGLDDEPTPQFCETTQNDLYSQHARQSPQRKSPTSTLPPIPSPPYVRIPVAAMDYEGIGETRAERARNRQLIGVLRAFKQASGDLLDNKYLGYEQQDINEFIMHLLEYTHTQLKNRYNMPSPQSFFVEGCASWNKYVQSNLSPVVSTFDGALRRLRWCPRGHEFQSHEIFRILMLHFPDEEASEITLEEMLQQFQRPEVIECRCSKCGGTDNKQFKQVTDVYVCPRYLIVTLGRFKQTKHDAGKWWAHKVKTKVNFPINNLDLSKVFEVCPGQPKPRYNLIAITNHKGSLMGGHYYTHIRSTRSGQQWHQLSDEIVKPVFNSNNLITNHAYMLFYERLT